jgi:5,5'-dehydrodivanillate O-demethylase oxygenase subunit
MLSADKSNRLTQIGPATDMGALLRRYWHPIAGVSEFASQATKPVRILGEDLVLYKDLSGTFGLIDRHCPHRRADLSYGMVEACGLRCNYHGWLFNETGACIEQPFEDRAHPQLGMRRRLTTKAYKVACKGGMVWAYMGPEPAPLLPDWEPFSWDNGFVQVVISEIPCNWFQCQENSIDPVHFEWMHENWGNRLRGENGTYAPAHLKLEFEEFEFGFVYKRIKEDTGEHHPNWTTGRVCLWPNGFFLGEHFEWRVPVDDGTTLSVLWKYTRVPLEQEPYHQEIIPTWHGPIRDENGRWISSHVMNQDFIAWVGQGQIADRGNEHLGPSDRGVVLLRRRFFEEMDVVAAGRDPKGVIRAPERNLRVALPIMDRADIIEGFTKAEILADPRKRLLATTFIFQAGQPAAVQDAFAAAMGLEIAEFKGGLDVIQASRAELVGGSDR